CLEYLFGLLPNFCTVCVFDPPRKNVVPRSQIQRNLREKDGVIYHDASDIVVIKFQPNLREKDGVIYHDASDIVVIKFQPYSCAPWRS
ncbi:hypothetical protein Bhyg_14917, partial [Pseudolycoriella hygida]